MHASETVDEFIYLGEYIYERESAQFNGQFL